jgi:Flp pilus assembly protein TadG
MKPSRIRLAKFMAIIIDRERAMQRLILKIIQLLDGTPAVYGKRQHGQSLVEMALITPILIVMLMGMVEIGWFANNYLTLLDVARAGARRGAVLQDQSSPLEWDNEGSYVPIQYVSDNDYTEQGINIAFSSTIGRLPVGTEESSRVNARSCDNSTEDGRPFYLELVCVMRASFSPLSLDTTNNIDDIIISAFSLARITDPPGGDVILGTNARPAGASANTHVVVVGRYPSNTNECDVSVTNPSTTPVFSVAALEPRDPFDFNQNNDRDVRANANKGIAAEGNGLFTEREGYDDRATTVATAERQVGYSYLGQHWIPGTGCLGSEWTVADVETLVNLPNYSMTDEQRRTMLPHQGLVLVEIYWEHEMLLRFPVFNPVISAFAGDQTPTIGVWAAFPLPSVEPSDTTLELP